LIDARLALTKEFQDEINQHEDVILLNETDINTCMFIFMPQSLYGGKRISAEDVGKLNACNLYIKTTILESGDALVHRFNLKRCYTSYFQKMKIYMFSEQLMEILTLPLAI
jgi:hypothetical protein